VPVIRLASTGSGQGDPPGHLNSIPPPALTHLGVNLHRLDKSANLLAQGHREGVNSPRLLTGSEMGLLYVGVGVFILAWTGLCQGLWVMWVRSPFKFLQETGRRQERVERLTEKTTSGMLFKILALEV
jgi:hypothetical protein